MVVHTETERVKETRRSILEFHLINHPLDCPVCDQAGECWLQIYYMRHGLYDPRMTDEKVHKPKAVPLGPHVILDAERCILCSRCVRFCDEVTGTGELGIFHRGDHSEIGLFPGQELANKYSANVVDICPVGALTERDFRFAVRVWYLDVTKSVCPGCARGCNVEVHVNRRRPHHNEGRRVARPKPRFNAAALLAAVRGRQVKCLWIFGHDLLASAWPQALVLGALGAAETLVWVGANANATSERAHWVLPAAAWVEREGTYTNFEGRVQRLRQAVEPLGQALPEWEILGRILEALGAGARPPAAERWFRELAAATPAFAGLSYQAIGDGGQMVRA